jgi:hypothetical protein
MLRRRRISGSLDIAKAPTSQIDAMWLRQLDRSNFLKVFTPMYAVGENHLEALWVSCGVTDASVHEWSCISRSCPKSHSLYRDRPPKGRTEVVCLMCSWLLSCRFGLGFSYFGVSGCSCGMSLCSSLASSGVYHCISLPCVQPLVIN